MLSSLAPARRRLLLAVLAVLLVALVAVLVAVRPDRRASGVQRAAQDQPGPVLLVPGYGGSITGLNTLAGRLRRAGKDVTVLSMPDNAEGDLGRQAGVLQAAARAALTRTGSGSVDVVGYSAGGVVARLWAKSYGGAGIARRVITLGAPQHGTALAALGSLVTGACPLACQQLVPTSSLLTALNHSPELPTGPVFVSLWSSRDEVVLPPDSARLAGALNIELQQVCASSAVSHAQLPTDPLVAAIVTTELSGDPARPLTAADCAGLAG
ncbi:MAG: lipase family alpha/beta hydrolase [Jatrophihabitantaceae bacterium]